MNEGSKTICTNVLDRQKSHEAFLPQMAVVHFWKYWTHSHLPYCYVISQLTFHPKMKNKLLGWVLDLSARWRWKTKLCTFTTLHCFTSINGRTLVKLVKICTKFMTTMLYKNISTNDGSWNSVLVILISATLLHQGGPSNK